MTTNIEISNINKHFFLDSDNNEHNSSSDTTKIIKYCFYSLNEIDISNKIQKIPYYTNNYLVLDDYDYVNISQINDKYIDKLRLHNDSKYFIFTYKNENLIEFDDFLYNFTNPKQFIFHTIQSFQCILKSLIKLKHKNICFFNLSPRNIVFNLDCGEKPILRFFDFSIQIERLNEEYFSNIIQDLDDYYIYKPFEVHVLFYLIKNNINTISYSFIEEISDFFIKNLSILNLFSEKYKESYKNACVDFLKKYINKSKTHIISDILKYNDKWDIYSISVLYIHIIGNLIKVFSLNDTFLSKLVINLSKNLNPDPLKRYELDNMLEIYTNLFDNQENWQFVNNLSSSKMIQLYDILEK